MKKIFIFHATAGHGHKKVAEVIAKSFEDREHGATDVRVFDSLDMTPALFKKSYPATYFYAVKYLPAVWGWFYETLDLKNVYAPLRALRSLINGFHGQKILDFVIKEKPDVLICTHFFTAELFATAKRKGLITAKLITVITDFLPHTFWVNEGTDYYWVMSGDGQEELKRRGVPEDMIIAGGIPVDPTFKPTGLKNEILAKYGFGSKRFTLLLTSGSFGLGPHQEILHELEEYKDKIQAFVVCGQNQTLQKSLQTDKFPFPVQVFGFVNFMPELMEASDLMIAKPGGATTTESLAKGVPMIILDPIPGQESRNAEIMKARNAAFAMKEPFQAKTILKSIFEHPQLLPSKREAIAKLAKPHAADDLVTFILKLPYSN